MEEDVKNVHYRDAGLEKNSNSAQISGQKMERGEKKRMAETDVDKEGEDRDLGDCTGLKILPK